LTDHNEAIASHQHNSDHAQNLQHRRHSLRDEPVWFKIESKLLGDYNTRRLPCAFAKLQKDVFTVFPVVD
jgi:hypothetical protein